MRRPAPSSSPRSSCSTRASSTRSSPSARRAGSGATPTRRGGRSQGGRRVRGGGRARRGRRGRTAPRIRRARRDRASSREPPGRPTRPGSRAAAPSRRQLDLDLDEPLYTARTPSCRSAMLQAGPVRRGARGRAGDPRHVRGRGPHPRLGDHPAARRGPRGRRRRIIVFSGDLGRPGTPDPARPDADDRRRLRPGRVDLRRPRARARGRGHPDPRRDRPHRRRRRRRAARPVVRHRAHAGGRLGARPAASTRGEIPLLPLYLDSPMASKATDIYRHHPEYYDEETDDAPAQRAARRSTTRTRS